MNSNSDFKDGLYSTTSFSLFEDAKQDVSKFEIEPSPYNIFNAATRLNHLREWIYPDGHESYNSIDDSLMTSQQKLHNNLHTNECYLAMRSICNSSKHFYGKETDEDRSVSGFMIGTSPIGGSVPIGKQYKIGDTLVLDKFKSLVKIYQSYFDAIQKS
ncbi:hypothetical protein HOH87_02440 [bacterium]|jgi:hypothetical protein|nr:hypothetical protein [bacterium]